MSFLELLLILNGALLSAIFVFSIKRMAERENTINLLLNGIKAISILIIGFIIIISISILGSTIIKSGLIIIGGQA